MAESSKQTSELELQLQFLSELNRNWTGCGLLPQLSPEKAVDHPFRVEFENLCRGEPASFPFFAKERIYWCLLASDDRGLDAGIATLRAWLIPSFGWEETDSIASKGDPQKTDLARLMLELSPTGYFRWMSPLAELDRIIRKLAEIRRLERVRPEIVVERIPSLLELRQRFALAIATRELATASAALKTINRYELDTAANGTFMRIELHRAFGTPLDIVRDPEIKNIGAMRVPSSVRATIVEAFYSVFLEKAVRQRDWTGAVQAYAESVYPTIGQIIEMEDGVNDSVDIQRCVACGVAFDKDSSRAHRLLAASVDPAVKAICALVPQGTQAQFSPMEAFIKAWEAQDWSSVQRTGIEILNAALEVDDTNDFIAAVLRKSLEYAPNSNVSNLLSQRFRRPPTPELPQNWHEVTCALRSGEFDRVLAFLRTEERPRLDFSSASQLDSVAELVNDVLSMPGLDQVKGVDLQDIIGSALIADCIEDAHFPKAELKGLYELLFQLWVAQRQKSALASSETTFLLLASGLLEIDVDSAGRIASAVMEWCNSRQSSRRVSFTVRAIELLCDSGTATSSPLELWRFVAPTAVRFWQELPISDRNSWLTLGRRLHVPAGEMAEFDLGAPVGSLDPLSKIRIKKVAIVSLNENAAIQAAAIIRERCTCEVVLVTDKSAGTGTASAQTADVILFVWRATKHAVYRAFDNVRDRLQYVTGSGTSSIVSSLEQWATQRLAEAA